MSLQGHQVSPFSVLQFPHLFNWDNTCSSRIVKEGVAFQTLSPPPAFPVCLTTFTEAYSQVAVALGQCQARVSHVGTCSA